MTPFIDFKTGKLLKQDKVEGIINISNEYQSVNRFNGLRTGPRDDIEMLFNFMFSLCHNYKQLELEYPPQTLFNAE
jgi:hypothetical protein